MGVHLPMENYVEISCVSDIVECQNQYVAGYFDGRDGRPILSYGLRWTGTSEDYHEILIHKDDVEVMASRIKHYREVGYRNPGQYSFIC